MKSAPAVVVKNIKGVALTRVQRGTPGCENGCT